MFLTEAVSAQWSFVENPWYEFSGTFGLAIGLAAAVVIIWRASELRGHSGVNARLQRLSPLATLAWLIR